MGKTLSIRIENLTGFTVVYDKIHPACEITVKDTEGNIVLYEEDVYANTSGYDTDTNLFSLTLTMANPITMGEYITTAYLYDKYNTENIVEITLKSIVIE